MGNILQFCVPGTRIGLSSLRFSTILKKFGGKLSYQAGFDYPLSEHEVNVIDLISRFPAVVEQAASEYRPLVIATFAYDLANAFHSFYHAVPVLQADSNAIRQARLLIVAATRQTLANALRLLDIAAPDMM